MCSSLLWSRRSDGGNRFGHRDNGRRNASERTSAVTGALVRLGAQPCRANDLIQTRSGNARGYWESRSLVRFNDELLASFGGAWWCPPTPEVLHGWRSTLSSSIADGRRLFESLHAADCWVWKDPRNCLLFPFWRLALSTPTVSIVVLRHPLEVAGSLRTRDRIGKTWALALWERYLRAALLNLAGSPALVVDYGEVIANPAAWTRLVVTFLSEHGPSIRAKGNAAVSFIDSTLRHNLADDDEIAPDGAVSPAQRALWAQARALRGPHNALPTIDLPPEAASTALTLAEIRRRHSPGRSPAAESTEDAMPRAAAREEAVLSTDWRRWLAKNRMLGVDADQLMRVIADHGLPVDVARLEVARLDEDPCFAAGRWAAQRLRKLESLLATQETLRALVPSARRVERRRRVPDSEFFTRYYAENRPLVLLEFIHSWRARYWTPDSLEQVLGDEEVEVMTGRESDERFEINSELHRATMTFRQFVALVRATRRSNDVYLVANNHLLDVPAATPLWDDFDAGQPPLDPERATGRVFIWFGPAGTVTPLHHDVANVLFVQVYGRKRFTLIPPAFTPRVYNETGVYGDVDPENPDYSLHPEYRGVPTLDVVLEPGETLFLPVAWWHRVESLDMSISLSFTNFVYPNEFHWHHPGD